MTRRQANTLMALGVAVIVTQILCTAVLLTKMEQTNKSAASAEIAAVEAQSVPTAMEPTDLTPPTEPTTPPESGPTEEVTARSAEGGQLSVEFTAPTPTVQIPGTYRVYAGSPFAMWFDRSSQSTTPTPAQGAPSSITVTTD